MNTILALTRTDIADYVAALFRVSGLIISAYLVSSRFVAFVEAVVSPKVPLPATKRSRGIETCVVTVRAGVVPEAGIVKVTGNCMFAPNTCAGVMNCVPEKYRSEADSLSEKFFDGATSVLSCAP